MLIQKETCLCGVEGKRRLSDSVEAINMDFEKKQKLDEGSQDQVSQFEAAEVARQPRREQ